MKGKQPVAFILLFSGTVLFIFLLMQGIEILYGGEVAILFPKGIVAREERDLLFIVQIIMLLVVGPVYVLTFVFSWKYKENHKNSKYSPEMDDHPVAEVLWWGIPLVIIIAIGTLTWIKTYDLNPYKPIESDKKPITIQVVALQWRWLFIYPEENIASINFFQVPEKTPINFEITSDAPMNSFWIPKMGGQIYAMPKMKTKLHLIADEQGEFRGSSANLSGKGFAKMHFLVKASSSQEYQSWLDSAKSSPGLDFATYNELAKPSEDNTALLFLLQDNNLFNKIIRKYTHP